MSENELIALATKNAFIAGAAAERARIIRLANELASTSDCEPGNDLMESLYLVDLISYIEES